MRLDRTAYRLYAITDRACLAGRSLADAVAAAIRGGATMVQIREKGVTASDYVARAMAVREVCDAFGVPLIVNDDPAVAAAAGAAGVHLGASDSGLRAARALLGPEAVLGATARTPEAARKAEERGATYIGCGAVFGTATKADAHTISPALFAAVSAAVRIPVVAIGGVTMDNAGDLAECGAAGLCAISAIFGQEDIEQAARALRQVADEVCI